MKKQTLNEELSRIKQIINENMDISQDVSDLGIPMPTPQEVEAVVACEDDDVPAEHENIFKTLKAKINQISDRNTLKQTFKDIRNAMRSKKQSRNEQAEAAAVMVLGVPVTTVALAAIGLLLLIGILQRLFRRREDGGVRVSCRQGASDLRRQFGRKLL